MDELENIRTDIDAAITRALSDNRIVGTVVLIARDGELVYQRAAGLADRESGTEMRVDTLFRLASVTKAIVSAASPQSRGTWQWGGVYGHSWFVDPERRLTVIALTNTALEGLAGRFPIELRDALYLVLSLPAHKALHEAARRGAVWNDA